MPLIRNAQVRYRHDLDRWQVTAMVGQREIDARFRNESAARLLHRNLLVMDATDTPVTQAEADLIVQDAETLDQNITIRQETMKSLRNLKQAAFNVRKYWRSR